LPARKVPENELKLRGTYRKDRHSDASKPAPKRAATPKWKAPTYLDDLAKKEWRRLTKEIEATPGLLSGVDESLLGQACALYSRWQAAEAMISAEGVILWQTSQTRTGSSRKPIPHPAIKVSAQYSSAYRSALSRLALTPVSKQRAEVTPPPAPEKDLLDHFLDKTGPYAHFHPDYDGPEIEETDPYLAGGIEVNEWGVAVHKYKGRNNGQVED
jgi:P27 family predicted phage terminase small subunit